MANPFSKGWKYLMQSFDTKIDQNADPKVQIQQAVAAAKEQHKAISEHAANIIGNRNQLQMKMERLIKSQEDLQTKARTALQASQKAEAAGDAEKSQQFNNAAEVIATQLVSVEQELEQTKQAYASADHAAKEAQQKQQQSEANLKEQLSQVGQLESQLNQARMQEQTAKTMDSMNQFNDDNVPTLDGVRDKIERRYANALGQQELMKDSMTDRMAEIESGSTDAAAASRLDQIRASISGELEAGSGTDAGAGDADRQLEAGSGEDSQGESSQGEAAEQKPSGSSRRVTAGNTDDSANTDDILADAEKYMRDED
ncbi:PspA/IM30 family protein [Corynebacterium pilbarense]|uniref:PspA/IM30 family protein n=1 Tax=Corynebacterium pilbarense TaxID=1288393 RepID=A0A9Q4IIG9_9CORY|nr:PspA/IM30 family protein [Corynebacterium pilbarense]MCZ2221551.1 PspA/IM30 family protein [Corynebacterium pilbarense]